MVPRRCRRGTHAVEASLDEKPPAREARITAPTTVLGPEHGPLFPRAWPDRLDDFFHDDFFHDVFFHDVFFHDVFFH
ncbi:hypothetical protein I5Q34_28215, partial [Streptomyces sp. AV19]|uniref:hypothetical protein n=1 Tax=Streptomyces sp. AV19 TaxID=2793068 RepID=UPI0018FE5201